MVVGDTYVLPGFLTPVLRQLFFPKPLTTFLTCFCRGERRKYAEKKSRLKRGSNSQPPGHESDTLTTEPPGRGSDLGTKVYKNTEKSSLYSQSLLIFIYKTPVVKSHPTTREIRDLLLPRSIPTGNTVHFYMSSLLIYIPKIHR